MNTVSPTNALRKRFVEDMNENLDLGDHWLLGGANAFLVADKGDESNCTVIASMHTNDWLLRLPTEDRLLLAASLACQLRIEIYTQLRLQAPACQCIRQGQHTGTYGTVDEVQ